MSPGWANGEIQAPVWLSPSRTACSQMGLAPFWGVTSIAFSAFAWANSMFAAARILTRIEVDSGASPITRENARRPASYTQGCTCRLTRNSQVLRIGPALPWRLSARTNQRLAAVGLTLRAASVTWSLLRFVTTTPRGSPVGSAQSAQLARVFRLPPAPENTQLGETCKDGGR